jgi:hypothetical protein
MAHNAGSTAALRPTRDSRADRASGFSATYQMIGNAVCPPLVAVLAGAVLAHSVPIENDLVRHLAGVEGGWEAVGRAAAVQLALSAVNKKQGAAAALV